MPTAESASESSILILKPWGPGVCIALELLIVLTILYLAPRRALLRDSEPSSVDYRSRPYSLAKAQLAYWTVLVLGSFVYLFFVKGSSNLILNNTAMLLLGISAGTTTMAAAAGSQPANPPTAPGAPGTAVVQIHKDFLADILSDLQGMNIHRLQMLMWTLTFGGVYVYEVVSKQTMPVFDNQAFVLMGISSGTYVWLKRSET